jgi:hypothetical protein
MNEGSYHKIIRIMEIENSRIDLNVESDVKMKLRRYN